MTVPDLAQRLGLYLVLDPDHVNGNPAEIARSAIEGGVTAVQLRVKRRTDREFLELATQIGVLCASANVLYLINDRVDIALAAKADGIHLGVDDLPLAEARALLGPGAVIGFSPETDQQTSAAAGDGANYLGVGPVYGTATKDDAGSAIGLGAIARRANLAGIPVIGIGGIQAGNARAVIDAGAVGVAVVSAITQAPIPEAAARSLLHAIRR